MEELSEQKFGVLSLGLFVGFLLGFGLMRSGPSLRAAVTVIGAALGGVPVVFLKDSTSKWMYPVGLLIGLLQVRLIEARALIAAKIIRPNRERRVHGVFAWIDLIVIAAVTVAAMVYSIVTK